jgi:hypothetical protein
MNKSHRIKTLKNNVHSQEYFTKIQKRHKHLTIKRIQINDAKSHRSPK